MSSSNLDLKVVVRRVAAGSAPFQWEVEREGAITPIQMSTERFRSMQDAYDAAQTWLADFVAANPARSRRSREARAAIG